ncbi:MAG: DUF455 family protein [Planctomycetes bacterium]|nr:DUF455 family protein [Planctomycetota bacterium]
MSGAAYVDALLAVIAAPTATAKAAALAVVPAPPITPWSPPPLPLRPGRPAHYREAIETGRRRHTLKHGPTRQRFLLAIHHIELTAVDLAAAASLAGPELPEAFHRDQLAVAGEEAGHALLLEELLVARCFPPGCESVHHRLWDAARACADLGEMLVVVPRYLEARGLDVSADLLPRLAALDPEAHAVIAHIYADEIGHVAIGTRWHRAWCAGRGLDPEAHFQAVVRTYFASQLPGPFPLDRVGRAQAGFSPTEMAFLSTPRVPGSA